MPWLLRPTLKQCAAPSLDTSRELGVLAETVRWGGMEQSPNLSSWSLVRGRVFGIKSILLAIIYKELRIIANIFGGDEVH